MNKKDHEALCTFHQEFHIFSCTSSRGGEKKNIYGHDSYSKTTVQCTHWLNWELRDINSHNIKLWHKDTACSFKQSAGIEQLGIASPDNIEAQWTNLSPISNYKNIQTTIYFSTLQSLYCQVPTFITVVKSVKILQASTRLVWMMSM